MLTRDNSSAHQNQRGIALITVLLVFALISLLAVAMQTQQERNVRQAMASLKNSQLFISLISLEDIAKAGLVYDKKRDNDANEIWDTASELWNQPFPINDKIKGAIYVRDLQGLFNLNSLHPNHGQSQQSLERFKRLLTELGMDTGIATSVREWFTVGSSFNLEYDSQTPPYSASEIIFTHPSELRLVSGVTISDYIEMEPYITALPIETPLNINTSLPEVISSWDAKLSMSQSVELINKTRSKACGPIERNNYVFKDVDALFDEDLIKELTDKTKNPDGAWEKPDFDVKSKYFSIFSVIELDGIETVLESVIKRDSDNDFIGTIYRDMSRTPEDIVRLMKTINCSGAQ